MQESRGCYKENGCDMKGPHLLWHREDQEMGSSRQGNKTQRVSQWEGITKEMEVYIDENDMIHVWQD